MMRALIAVIALGVAAPTLAQEQSSPERADDPLPARRDAGVDKMMQDAERQRVEDRTNRIADPSTPEARTTLYQAASCLAKASADESSGLLKMDFRSPAYRAKMDRLFDNNRKCVTARWIRSNRLLVAGDLAEVLLAASSDKVNVRLAMLPAQSPAKPRTPTDAVAFCAARSDPDGVAKLLSTPVASVEEATAATALNLALSRCNQTGKAISATAAGVRAMLATATYRLLEGQED